MKKKKLTYREAYVIMLLSVGLTKHQVAEKLGISHQTVKNDCARVYKKIGTNLLPYALVRTLIYEEVCLADLTCLHYTRRHI